MPLNDWISEYEKKKALWFHDGNQKRPHALLTSGKHSNGFFNSWPIRENPSLLGRACFELAIILHQHYGLDPEEDDRVVGLAEGGISMAHEIAYHISTRIGPSCLLAYVEKQVERGVKSMVFKSTAIRPGERIILADDVLSTGESVDLAAKAVIDAGGIVLPFVVVLVNRSGLAEVFDKKIVALIDYPMQTWSPDECPLCRQGSEAIRPDDNWARLNANY